MVCGSSILIRRIVESELPIGGTESIQGELRPQSAHGRIRAIWFDWRGRCASDSRRVIPLMGDPRLVWQRHNSEYVGLLGVTCPSEISRDRGEPRRLVSDMPRPRSNASIEQAPGIRDPGPLASAGSCGHRGRPAGAGSTAPSAVRQTPRPRPVSPASHSG